MLFGGTLFGDTSFGEMVRSTARRAVRIECAVVRMPLVTLDRRLVEPLLGRHSTAHVLLAQGVKSLDVLAGHVPDRPTHTEPSATFYMPHDLRTGRPDTPHQQA